MTLFHLACTRGADTFGLSITAWNVKQALKRAKEMLDGSGYSVYPLPNKAERT
jgi:hypothetical protein